MTLFSEYVEQCALLCGGPDSDTVKQIRTHTEAIGKLITSYEARGEELAIVPWYRHPVMIRKPTLFEWEEYQAKSRAYWQNMSVPAKQLEASRGITNVTNNFAASCVVYPNQGTLEEWRKIKLDLFALIERTVSRLVADDIDADALKLHGL